jgi:hypothetical protein
MPPLCYSAPARYSTTAVLQCFASYNPRVVHAPSSRSIIISLDIVALSVADAKVLKQRLDALIVAVDAAEEKADTARRRVLAARQLLDEEQAATTDLKWQAVTKKLVPGSTSFTCQQRP